MDKEEIIKKIKMTDFTNTTLLSFSKEIEVSSQTVKKYIQEIEDTEGIKIKYKGKHGVRKKKNINPKEEIKKVSF